MVPVNLSKSISFCISVYKWTKYISVSCWIYSSGDSISKETAVLHVEDDEGHLHCPEYKREHRFGKLLGLTETDGQSCLPVSSLCLAVEGTRKHFTVARSQHPHSVDANPINAGMKNWSIQWWASIELIHKLLVYVHHGCILRMWAKEAKNKVVQTLLPPFA